MRAASASASARSRFAGLCGDAPGVAFAGRPGTFVKGSEPADFDMPMRPATTSFRGLGGEGPKPAEELGLGAMPSERTPSDTNSRRCALWPSGVSKLVEPGGPRGPSPDRPANGMPPGAPDLDGALKLAPVLRTLRSNSAEEFGEKPSEAHMDSEAFVEPTDVLNLVAFFFNKGELRTLAGAFAVASLATADSGRGCSGWPAAWMRSVTEGPNFTSAAISEPAASSRPSTEDSRDD